MAELLLGSPLVHFYLLVLGAGLLLALWPDGGGPRGKAAGARARARGDQSAPREGGGRACAAQSLSAMTGGRALLAIQDLEAACAAAYATRFGLAIRRIRKS